MHTAGVFVNGKYESGLDLTFRIRIFSRSYMPNTQEQQREVVKRASVTVPLEIVGRATQRAKSLDRNFSSYVRWLIKRDLESAQSGAGDEPHAI